MAIKQISVETENDIKKYTCLTLDKISDYPTDCLPTSRMVVMNINGNKVGELMYDGTGWFTIYNPTVFEDTIDYHIVNETIGMNAFEIDVLNKTVKNVSIEVPYDIPEVIQATVVGDVTLAGELTITLTSALYEEDKIYGVLVALEDTAIQVAQKIVDGIKPHLEADFIVEALDEIVQLTVKNPTANDTTLNLSIVQDTATGLTDDTTSAITTVGAVNDKGLVLYNLNTRCELTVELNMIAPAVITYPTGTIWDTEAPTYVAGKKYLLKFYTNDGGTVIKAKVIGTW